MIQWPEAAWSRACGRWLVAASLSSAWATSFAPSAWGQAAGASAGTAAPSSAELLSAKKHYADGEKKYSAKDYAGALQDFRVANEVKPTPQAERYIGLCEDALGHPATAADWYTKFLAHVPEKMAVQGDEARHRLADIQAMPGKVHVDSVPPGAEVTIDDKAQPAPTPFDVELAPGSHTLAFKEAGRVPAQKLVDVGFASTQDVSVELQPAAPPPPPAPAAPPPVAAAPPPPPNVPPPQETRSAVPAIVTGALAVAAAGAGTAFGILALNDKAKFDRDPTTQTADSGDTHSLVADMCFGVAVTFAVTSIVLFATRDEPSTIAGAPPRTAKARPAGGLTWAAAPMVGAHLGGAGLVLKY